MNIQRVKNVLAFSLLLLFNFAFWRESWGVNLVIFGLSLSSVLYFINNEETMLDFKLSMLVLGQLATAVSVLVFNSNISVIAYIVSVLLVCGVFIQKKFQSIYYLGFSVIANMFRNFPQFGKRSKEEKEKVPFIKRYNWIKISLIPISLTVLFYYLYRLANPAFNEWTKLFWANFAEYWEMIFEDYPLTRFLFIAVGGLIISSLVWAKPILAFIKSDEKELNDMSRDKKLKTYSKHGVRKARNVIRGLSQDLVNEYRIALLTFASLNVLLLIFNISDIYNVWLGKAYTVSGPHFSQMLHTGTTLLIFTILLSVGIVLFHFRGNLNFLRKRKLVKNLAMIWLFQNVILALGVMMRAYHYISYYGLTYKRIGVVVFTLLVVGGLFTVINKVRGSKTTYYLYRQNFAYSYIVLVLLSFFNWDVYIAKHNLTRIETHDIDTNFLLDLNERALFVLEDHKTAFEGKYYNKFFAGEYRGMSQIDVLNKRIRKFKKQQEKRTFWSWNYGDEKCLKELTEVSM